MKARACSNVFAATLMLATGFPGVVWGSHADLFFAAPFSGDKVSEYDVSLTVTRDETRVFTIPDQCPAAIEALTAGASQWCSRLEKRLWQKVAADCNYHAFLHRFSPAQGNDAVSDFDFRNAAIGDLLVSFRCGEGMDESIGEGGCTFGPPPVADIAPLLRFADPAGDVSDYDAESCRLTHGSFRGYVVADAQGLRCRPDSRAPGIRVLSVDYADVNGDGWVDAVLRIVPIGPGANRRPLVLAYTRIGTEAPLTVPVEGSPPIAEEASGPP